MPVQIVQLLTEPDILPTFQYLFEKEHGPVPFEVSNTFQYLFEKEHGPVPFEVSNIGKPALGQWPT